MKTKSRIYAFRNLNFTIGYDPEDFWKLVEDKKRYRVNIKDLNISSFSWSKIINGKEIFYSILDVYKNQKQYKNEVEKAIKSNLNYPIILINDEILDGNHRVLKALILKHDKIYAKYITEEELTSIEIEL